MSTDFIKPKHSFRRWYVYAFIFALITILAFYQSLQIFAAAPSNLVTGSATSVTTTTATLSGRHFDEGSLTATSRGFEYGTSVSYGSTASETGSLFVDAFGEVEFATTTAIDIEVSELTGNIYVLDNLDTNVKIFNSAGVFQTEFGASGAGDGQLTNPYALALDSADNIYVADTGNSRVQIFNSAGVYASQFAIPHGAQGIDVDSSGNIYVNDSVDNVVRKYTSVGVLSLTFASGQLGANSHKLALDSSGNVYVADYTNDQIDIFDATGAHVTSFGSNGVGNGQFSGVVSVAVDEDDYIYVGDENVGRIQIFNDSNTYVSQFGTSGSGNGQFFSIFGIEVDENKDVFAADTLNTRIQKFDTAYSLSVTGLSCGTTYHYRAFVTNTDGTGNGSDATFTTDDCPAAPSSSGGGGGGTRFICTDPKALNYTDPDTDNGREKNSTCRYDENKLSCSVDPYLTKAVKLGAANNPADVMLLEKFLNTYENAALAVNGIYEKADFYNVVAWQEKYPNEILKPWGLKKGSGYVYVTSLQKIKEIHEAKCQDTYIQNTANSSCFVFTENLYRGMRKVEIKAAQKALQASIAPGLKADGVFGPGTEKAVKAFQALHGIRQSGGIGPLTGAELEKVACQI